MTSLGPSLKEKSGQQANKIPHSKENLPKLLFINNEVGQIVTFTVHPLTVISTSSQRTQKSLRCITPRMTVSLPTMWLLPARRM